MMRSLREIAAAGDGVHDGIYDAATACFLATHYQRFFPILSAADVVSEDDIKKKCLKPIRTIVLQKLASEDPGGNVSEEEMKRLNTTIDYIDDRLREAVDHFDHITFFWQPSGKEEKICLPLRSVFFAVYDLLFDKDNSYFRVAELDREKARWDRIYRLYSSMAALSSEDKEKRICHTGVRRHLMDTIQSLSCYLPAAQDQQAHTIMFPADGIVSFIHREFSHQVELLLNSRKNEDLKRWCMIVKAWATPEAQRAVAEQETLNAFIQDAAKALSSEAVTQSIHKSFYSAGHDPRQYTAQIDQCRTADNIMSSIQPTCTLILSNHLATIINLRLDDSDQRNAQLKYLQNQISACATFDEINTLRTAISGFLDVEFLRTHFNPYCNAIMRWNQEKYATLNVLCLNDLLSHYHERALTELALSAEEQGTVQQLRSFISEYENDDEISTITNYFASLFQEGRNEIRVAHGLRLYDPTFQEKFKLSDDNIQQLIDQQTVEGVLSITPYDINRVFMHALAIPITEWTPLFAETLCQVKNYVSNSLGRQNQPGSGLALALRATSYTSNLLFLLNYVDNLYSNNVGDEEQSFSNHTNDFAKYYGLYGLLSWVSDDAVFLDCFINLSNEEIANFPTALLKTLIERCLPVVCVQAYPADGAQIYPNAKNRCLAMILRLGPDYLEKLVNQDINLLDLCTTSENFCGILARASEALRCKILAGINGKRIPFCDLSGKQRVFEITKFLTIEQAIEFLLQSILSVIKESKKLQRLYELLSSQLPTLQINAPDLIKLFRLALASLPANNQQWLPFYLMNSLDISFLEKFSAPEWQALRNSFLDAVSNTPEVLGNLFQYISMGHEQHKSSRYALVFEQVKDRLPKTIQSINDFCNIMKFLPPLQRGIVFDLMQNKIPGFIKTATDLIALKDCLEPAQYNIIYDAIKERVVKLITNWNDLKGILATVPKVYEEFICSNIQDRILNLFDKIKDIENEFLVLPEPRDYTLERFHRLFARHSYSPLVGQCLYNSLLGNAPYFISELSKKTPEQVKLLNAIISLYLFTVLKSWGDVANLLASLSDEQCRAIAPIIADNLNNSRNGYNQVSDIDTEILLNMLKDFSENKFTVVCQTILSKAVRRIEQINLMLTILSPEQYQVAFDIAEDALSEAISSVDEFVRVFHVFREAAPEKKLPRWLKERIISLIESTKDLGFFERNPNKEDNSFIFEEIKEHLLSLINSARSFYEIMSCPLDEPQRAFIRDNVKDRISTFRDWSNKLDIFCRDNSKTIFGAALPYLTGEQIVAICSFDIERKYFTNLKFHITDAESFNLILEHHTPDQRVTIYNQLKTELRSYVTSCKLDNLRTNFFKLILQFLADEQRCDFYQSLKKFYGPDFSIVLHLDSNHDISIKLRDGSSSDQDSYIFLMNLPHRIFHSLWPVIIKDILTGELSFYEHCDKKLRKIEGYANQFFILARHITPYKTAQQFYNLFINTNLIEENGLITVATQQGLKFRDILMPNLHNFVETFNDLGLILNCLPVDTCQYFLEKIQDRLQALTGAELVDDFDINLSDKHVKMLAQTLAATLTPSFDTAQSCYKLLQPYSIVNRGHLFPFIQEKLCELLTGSPTDLPGITALFPMINRRRLYFLVKNTVVNLAELETLKELALQYLDPNSRIQTDFINQVFHLIPKRKKRLEVLETLVNFDQSYAVPKDGFFAVVCKILEASYIRYLIIIPVKFDSHSMDR